MSSPLLNDAQLQAATEVQVKIRRDHNDIYVHILDVVFTKEMNDALVALDNGSSIRMTWLNEQDGCHVAKLRLQHMNAMSIAESIAKNFKEVFQLTKVEVTDINARHFVNSSQYDDYSPGESQADWLGRR